LAALVIAIARRIFDFDWFFVTVTLVSALVAVVATTANIQKTDNLPLLANRT
jgi:hypothetical protein